MSFIDAGVTRLGTYKTNVATNAVTLLNNSNVYWKALWVFMFYASSATAGNRNIAVALIDNVPSPQAIFGSNFVHTASLGAGYNFFNGTSMDTIKNGLDIKVPIPENLIVPPGFSLTFYDYNNISISDTISVYFEYEKINT